jgi:hypothetical protein
VTHRASSAAAQRARPMGWRRDEQGLWGDGVTRMFNGAAARRVGPVGRWRAGPATAAACRSSGAACRSCRQGRRIVLFPCSSTYRRPSPLTFFSQGLDLMATDVVHSEWRDSVFLFFIFFTQ